MRRIVVLVLTLSVIVPAAGCLGGRLFRRGARCDVPSFRFPGLRKFQEMRSQAPCEPACPPQPGWTEPGVTYESGPAYPADYVQSPGMPTSPIEGVPIETSPPTGTRRPIYPVYAEKPVVPSEILEGPEMGSPPTAP
jgi:hypothetical protein